MHAHQVEAVLLFDCLTRFMALANMYSSEAVEIVRSRVRDQLQDERNYQHEEDFLRAADQFLEIESRT